ncbi:MAG: mechanosensitive ion channel family protein [FCB group bacterium]|nr:mechanosensitive ion channel family protein [FCB group bacterium]
MVEQMRTFLIERGLAEQPAEYLTWLAISCSVLILAWLTNFLAKRFLLAGVSYFVKKSKTKWDDTLAQQKVFVRLSHLAPALVISYCAPLFGPIAGIIQRLSMVYLILVGLLVVYAFLNALVEIYRTYDVSRQKPIKGYIQVVKIFIAVFVGIMVVAIVAKQPVWPILTGLGAMTAVLLFVFKDSILGLVASVQLSGNNMIQIGDWIEMPKYGADGDVVDITLHTVKIQNWDKTISSIPAYALISDSFKNWRGMSDSGGRRIKRAFNIDMTSISFCTTEMLARFENFQLISEYVISKREEVAAFNREHEIETSQLVNGRSLTNIGTLRAYIVAYLRQHPKIHDNMTFLVRQLPPGQYGLPLEIYVFSNDQEWAGYEAIQADIFDHILAVIPMFDLRLFQNPTGADFRGLTGGTDRK